MLQELQAEQRAAILQRLNDKTFKEVESLLQYADDVAGGLMSPRFARCTPDISVEEALRRLRKQACEHLETINYVYVVGSDGLLLGVCSFREIFTAESSAKIRDIMQTELVVVNEGMDQEIVARLFEERDLLALPVIGPEGQIKGIITIDDIIDVVEQEATEDAQKFGGMEALDMSYNDTTFLNMFKKRGGWLAILFVGELLTATAMAFYEDEIAAAVVLAVFVPLIISSGGNSGSQASTLIIRAMALGEIMLRDWWRIAGREILSGVTLGILLAAIGGTRIFFYIFLFLWQGLFGTYGEHYALIGLTVCVSLVGVVNLGYAFGLYVAFHPKKAWI